MSTYRGTEGMQGINPSDEMSARPSHRSMDNTGESVTNDSPLFVRRASFRHNALAAGFVVGDSVLDVGSGDCMLYSIIRDYINNYHAVDNRQTVMKGGQNFHFTQGDSLSFLANAGRLSYDTTVAMEVLEHIDPGMQARFLQLLWMRTRRRMILSTPDPDAHAHYPESDIFYGPKNPFHLREIPEWMTRKYILTNCPGAVIHQALYGRILPGDDLVWGNSVQGFTSNYLLVVDRIGQAPLD